MSAAQFGPTNEQIIANAEKMFGTGSPQHIKAIQKYGSKK